MADHPPGCASNRRHGEDGQQGRHSGKALREAGRAESRSQSPYIILRYFCDETSTPVKVL